MSAQQTIAHYRITSKIGEGGMGAVYCAIDTKLTRDVAIKVLPDAFAADPDRRPVKTSCVLKARVQRASSTIH